jgi:hypothetical protein
MASKETLPDDWLDQIKAAYPKRTGGHGWGYLKTRIPLLISEGHAFDEMLAGCKSYAQLAKTTGKYGTEYVMQARTFFGPGEWWLEEYVVPDGEYVKTLDDEASECGLQRAPNESDESLRSRVGTAQTKSRYGIS